MARAKLARVSSGVTAVAKGSEERVLLRQKWRACGALARPVCGAARASLDIRAYTASTQAPRVSASWETARGRLGLGSSGPNPSGPVKKAAPRNYAGSLRENKPN